MPPVNHSAFLLSPAIFQGFDSDIQANLISVLEAIGQASITVEAFFILNR